MSTDQARSVLADPRAPESERYDANAELMKSHRALASELVPSGDMRQVIDVIQNGILEEQMNKASRTSQVIAFPSEHSARGGDERGMKSVYLDKLQLWVNGEYYEKPAPFGYEGMRQMVEQTPILSAVVMTRMRQVARFCQISEDGGPGFEIRHRERKHELTPDERESCKLLGQFVSNCGWEFNPRRRKAMRRDNFAQFMAKSVRDSLTFDAAPIECEMKQDRKLGMDAFYAVDGSTVRLCTEEGYAGDDEIFALQVIQGQIRTAYSYDTLIYEVRNPRTDVRLAGYGLGECELLIKTVTGLLNAMAYNAAGFDQNAIPRGILQLVGDYGQEDLAAFKRYWNAAVKGISNAWTVPVMASTDPASKVTFEKFGADFDEMMFSKYVTFLTSIICSIYGMAPDEINFESFASNKSALSGSDTEEKLANSKDLGLHPLMSYYESTISDFIISDFSDKLCFRWVGVRPEDEEKLWEAKKLLLTNDELRAEQGYEPHPDPKIGALPLNPAHVGPAMQLAQPAAPGGDFGGAPPEQQEQPDYGNPDEDSGQGDDQAGAPPGGTGGAPPPGQGGDFGSSSGGSGAGGDFGKGLTIFSVGG